MTATAHENARSKKAGSGEARRGARGMGLITEGEARNLRSIESIGRPAGQSGGRKIGRQDGRSDMRRGCAGAFVVTMPAVPGTRLTGRRPVGVMSGAVDRADNQDCRASGVWHPTCRQQGAQQHRDNREMDGSQAAAADHGPEHSCPCPKGSSNQSVADRQRPTRPDTQIDFGIRNPWHYKLGLLPISGTNRHERPACHVYQRVPG
jgi:hypothetical protein